MTDTALPKPHPPADSDSWLEIARTFRAALQLVRPGEYPECLPGEKQACGGDAAGHVMATAALLGAIGLHHAQHAGPHREAQFWEHFDQHRYTLGLHHGDACDCAPNG